MIAMPSSSRLALNVKLTLRLQEIDELFKIFRVLGTPDESTWPGVSRYPDFKDTFPKWPARNLAELVPTLEPAGIEVLSLMLRYAIPSDGRGSNLSTASHGKHR